MMVYIEPTPYIIALIDRLRLVGGGWIEAYYITTNLSQPWALRLESGHARVLPRGFLARMQTLRQALTRDRGSTILHLAGWGHPVLLGALLMARSLKIPVAVESDTAEGRPDPSWRHVWRDWVKKLLYPLLFRLPSRFLPGGTRQARYLGQYGVEQERMTIAQMTVDVCAIRRFCSQDREAARSAARARWGMSADARNSSMSVVWKPPRACRSCFRHLPAPSIEENDLCLAVAGDGSLRARVKAIAAKPDCRVTSSGVFRAMTCCVATLRPIYWCCRRYSSHGDW